MRKHRKLTDEEQEFLRAIGTLMHDARRPRAQRKVAGEIGTSQTRISRWESGGAIPDVIDLIRFARACSTRPERLIRGVAAPSVEQLHRDLDARAGAVVEELVDLLHERPPQDRPSATPDRA